LKIDRQIELILEDEEDEYSPKAQEVQWASDWEASQVR